MLDEKDEERVRKIVKETVVDAMTEVMMPVLDRIMTTQDEHSKDLKTLKEDVETVKENVHDLQLTTGRIEMLQRHELDRVDDHEVRIVELEKVTVK